LSLYFIPAVAAAGTLRVFSLQGGFLTGCFYVLVRYGTRHKMFQMPVALFHETHLYK
jgi:hypothetical protein